MDEQVESIMDSLYEKYRAIMDEREKEFLGDIDNWKPTGIKWDEIRDERG